MSERYKTPKELSCFLEQGIYNKWLTKKATSLVKRDRKRGNKSAVRKEYKEEIHRVICESKGLDVYTGEMLNWSLLRKQNRYNNDDSKKGGRDYKKGFALLPTVDHVDVDDGMGVPNFEIGAC